MSRGIGAYANLIYQDEESITYEYGGYSLNEVGFRNENHIKDGKIIIKRECFDCSDSYEIYLNTLIKIENCSNCWMVTNDDLKIDVMALHILYKIFSLYKNEGGIPERISYHV